jgi:alpha-tubulin suppressor-like RCC1 family protein
VSFVVFALVASFLTTGAPLPAAGSARVPEAGTANWRAVSAGGLHTCGIRTTGRLYCWGSDANGQLGNGAVTGNQTTPRQVAGGHTTWTSVSAGLFHTCGIRAGRAYCWGNDGDEQLGNGPGATNATTPRLVAGGFTNWTNVDAGDEHSCGRRGNGALYCWGDDTHGGLGDGPPELGVHSPVQEDTGALNWTVAGVGNQFACGRRTTGELFCWGANFSGQLGIPGSSFEEAAPVEVDGGLTTWATLSVGTLHTCSRQTTGRLYCWGTDGEGQIGNGLPLGSEHTPVEVQGGHTTWTSVSAGGVHTCGRRTNGRLYCWGDDDFGELGNGAANTGDRPAPVLVAGGATNWTGLSAGGAHTCALRSTRRLYCWGWDQFGQLGNGGPSPVAVPAPVEVAA